MKRLVKNVLKTVSMAFCSSAMVTMIPTVVQAHGDIIININESSASIVASTSKDEDGILLYEEKFTNILHVNGKLGWVILEGGPESEAKWQCASDNTGTTKLVKVTRLRQSTTEKILLPGKTLCVFQGVKVGKGMVYAYQKYPSASKKGHVIHFHVKVEK